MALRYDSRRKAVHHSDAGTEVRDYKSNGWLHPCHLHSHQTMDLSDRSTASTLSSVSSMTERWEDQGVHAMADTPTRNLEAT